MQGRLQSFCVRLAKRRGSAFPPVSSPENCHDFASWLTVYRRRLEQLLEDGKAAQHPVKEEHDGSNLDHKNS